MALFSLLAGAFGEDDATSGRNEGTDIEKEKKSWRNKGGGGKLAGNNNNKKKGNVVKPEKGRA